MWDRNSICDVNQAKHAQSPLNWLITETKGEKKPKKIHFYALHMKWNRCFATSAGFHICFSFLVFQSPDVSWAHPAGRQEGLAGEGDVGAAGAGMGSPACTSPQNGLGAFRCQSHPTRVPRLWPKVLCGAQGCRKEPECGLL